MIMINSLQMRSSRRLPVTTFPCRGGPRGSQGERLDCYYHHHHHHRRCQRSCLLSTWSYPDHNGDGVVTEKDYARARHLVALKQQTTQLARHLRTAARQHLVQQFPKSFAASDSGNGLQFTQDLWVQSNNSNHNDPKALQLSDAAQTLLTLNGFQEVPPPTAVDSLPLAEGVLALPNFYSRLPARSRKNQQRSLPYRLFAQPIDNYDINSNKNIKSKYPPIVQEDIQLYRILENQAERWLNYMYSKIFNAVDRRIIQPTTKVVHQIQSTKIVKMIKSAGGSTTQTEPKKNRDKEATLPSSTSSSTMTNAPSSSKGANSVVKPNEGKEEALENLLVLSRNEVILYHQMSPSARLVTLPYTLGHKSASTLISVSLVVFGALPLAYRSYNFAFLYPWMSQALAGSVVFTICYGLLSQRYNARMSQSYAVTLGLWRRVYARDNAVVVGALQEGAVQRLAQDLLVEYLHRLPLVKDEIQFLEIPPQRPTLPRVASEESSWEQPEILIDPIDLAVDLGLLEKKHVSSSASSKSSGEGPVYYKAVPLHDGMAKF